MNLLDSLRRWLNGIFRQPQPPPIPPGPAPETETPEPVTRKVLVIVFDPPVPSQGDQRLSHVLHWNAVEPLLAGYLADLQSSSHGYLNYEVVEKIVVDAFPRKQDGFLYQPNQYLLAQRAHGGFHDPDGMDYAALLEDFHLVDRVNRGEIDEVWMFGPPYAGFYELRMAGPGAFFCNAPPLTAPGAQRRFVIMGFNYERGVGEMLEAFGHRAESILRQAYRAVPAGRNYWAVFIRYDKVAPGQAECGTVHFAPNSQRDYDWGNPARVPSRWRNWQSFPNLNAAALPADARDWGRGDIRAHHVWWLSLFPHIRGESDGVAWNWWRCVVDPNEIR